MTADIGFSEAPAPMAIGDLEAAGVSDEAPAPVDLGSLGSVTGDAPAPMDIEELAGSTADTAPAPSDLGGIESAVAEADAPTPFGGPGDVTAGSVEAGAAVAAPAPMSMSDLEALEAN